MGEFVAASRAMGISPIYVFAFVMVDLAFLMTKVDPKDKRWWLAWTMFFFANLGSLVLMIALQIHYSSLNSLGLGCIITPSGETYWMIASDISLFVIIVAAIFKALRLRLTPGRQ